MGAQHPTRLARQRPITTIGGADIAAIPVQPQHPESADDLRCAQFQLLGAIHLVAKPIGDGFEGIE